MEEGYIFFNQTEVENVLIINYYKHCITVTHSYVLKNTRKRQTELYTIFSSLYLY